jgi:hypothetical protein
MVVTLSDMEGKTISYSQGPCLVESLPLKGLFLGNIVGLETLHKGSSHL